MLSDDRDYLAMDGTGEFDDSPSLAELRESFRASAERSLARRRGMTAGEYVLAALMALMVIACGAVFCAYVLYLLA